MRLNPNSRVERRGRDTAPYPQYAGDGFTLIELMVVLVLIGITTAMILPEMRGTYEGAMLRSSAWKLINAFEFAQSRAITRNQTHQVRVNSSSGEYVVEAADRQSAGGFARLEDVRGAEGQLEGKIQVQFRRIEDGAEQSITSSRETTTSDAIRFYADGTADAAEITLRDRQGFEIGLQVNPITGRVRVVDVERE